MYRTNELNHPNTIIIIASADRHHSNVIPKAKRKTKSIQLYYNVWRKSGSAAINKLNSPNISNIFIFVYVPSNHYKVVIDL